MTKVLFVEGIYSLADPGMKKLSKFAEIKRMSEYYMSVGVTPTPSENEISKQIKDIDFVVTRWGKISRVVLDNANKLQMIVSDAITTLGNVDLEAANKKGVLVSAVPFQGDGFSPVAEHAFTLLLAIWRKLFTADKKARSGDFWARREPSLLPYQLKGRQIGIIGFGNIGRKVARMANAFEMKVLAYDPYVPQDQIKENGAQAVDLQTLLKNSDIVTIHCALTEETRHLIGKEELGLMKPEAFLINSARGALVDEKALYEVLKNGKIAGAGLDVYETEPPEASNPILKLGNVVVTPHMAGLTYETVTAQSIAIAEEIISVMNGETPKYLVKPKK